MKLVNIILFWLLLVVAIYVVYRLITVGELDRLDRILMIVFLAGTFLQSAIRSRIKKKQEEDTSKQ
jgi:hypothetical protein